MFTQLAISTSYVIFLAFVQKHSLQNHPPHIHTPPYPPHLPHLPHQEINSKRTTLSFCNTRTLTASAFTQPTSQHVPCSWPVIRRLCPLHLPLPSRLLHHAYDVGVPTQSSCQDSVGHRCCSCDLGVLLCVHYEEEWEGILQKDGDAGNGLV